MIKGDEISFIDFGLSFFSTKVEDKAVDLHLLKRALDSKHFEPDEINEKSRVVGGKTSDNLSSGIFEDDEIDTVQEAVDSCPVSVISLEEI